MCFMGRPGREGFQGLALETLCTSDPCLVHRSLDGCSLFRNALNSSHFLKVIFPSHGFHIFLVLTFIGSQDYHLG